MRHGETDWNAKDRIHGVSDIPLNSKGIEQSRKASELLATENIETIYASDLKRAKKTGDIVSATLDLPIHYTKRLREINFGKAEGVKISDLPAKFSYNFQAFNDVNNPERYDVRFPNGESVGEAQQRFMKFINRLLDDGRQSVLVVTHGVLIRIFAEVCLKKTINLDNCSVLRVTYNEKSKKFKSAKILF